MTKSTKQKLTYQKNYNARPEEKERRAALGRARYEMEKKGQIAKGQDVGLMAEQVLNGLYNSYVLLAVPLFILAANLMNAGTVSDRLFDFSRVLAEVPGCYLFVGACPTDPMTAPGNHAPGARFDDAVLGDCARLLAELAVRELAAG